MEHQPYLPGTKPADPGPLSRFTPPLEEGVLTRWLPLHARPGTWVLDPFGFSPRLTLEAARAGYRVLVTVNNPITRFLLEMSARPPSESDFKAALAELAVVKKGEERLQAHLQSLYLTTCENCEREIGAESFLWRSGEDVPYARVYKCPHCEDAGERAATQQDIERAKKIAATDGLHRSRAFERVAAINDEDRIYAEEAIAHYLPRPLYFLTTVINRLDGLKLTPERKRALTALILLACDAGNTLWGHPFERPRPRQLNIPNQYREHNLWMMLERGLSLWTETGSGVVIEAWPRKLPESGGICIYEGRLKDLAREVKKEIPIAAVIGSLPRPNQAFWTLSALWAGWLWGREAVEPFKVALRRRRYDWAWNATALHAMFSHLFDLLPLGTSFFGLLPEPEPSFLTSALTAASAAGFDLTSLALRTEHDPIQLTWRRGETLKREVNEPDLETVREAMMAHLTERGEPAGYLHLHAAGLIALAEAHALKKKEMEFDEALRMTQSLIQRALSDDERFVHYSSGESVETGMWGLSSINLSREATKSLAQREGDSSVAGLDTQRTPSVRPLPRNDMNDSLSDRIEIAIVTFLQKNPDSIYLEIEDHLYPQFPGLLTPSKGMIYAVLDSYAQRDGAAWRLRPEDVAAARRSELTTITAMLEAVGKRLNYVTRKQDKNYLWEDGTNNVVRAFYILASALIGRAMSETPYPPEKTIVVIPGGRAGLIQYKAGRDPSLAARMKNYRIVKYRLLRALFEVPVLTRETFEEQIASDPLEKSRSQMMMF
ncbi:MAG: hypothetical protein HUU11_06435 [Anaerolineales bacterium]|nr:hypothetical protein [Anaerolineales bacterium]